jgi:2,4-dienoyl-CoA reductase-like NADH-dependent reductase (Old Yellow Enzyme family)
MVDERQCGGPGDLVVETNPKDRPFDAWKRYASACQASGTPGIVQINHPGRQSPVVSKNTRPFWEKPLAPSAIPLNIGDSLFARWIRAFMFGTPREMSTGDIKAAIHRFVETTQFVHEAGFAGIQLHGAQ